MFVRPFVDIIVVTHTHPITLLCWQVGAGLGWARLHSACSPCCACWARIHTPCSPC